MKKIIALGGSNSKESVNKQFAYYVAKQIENGNVVQLDLNDFKIPMYGIDEENENGIPQDAKYLSELIKNADGIVLSLAEHNGAYSAAFKSVFDWVSRIDAKVFETTPMLLLSTSPGARAGASVMAMALERFPRHGASILAHYSLPSFYENYKNGEIVNEEMKEELLQKIKLFKAGL